MSNVTRQITISDFSPGIHGDYHGGVAEASKGSLPRNGAATISGTYRCASDLSGALMPLPAATVGKTDAPYQIGSGTGWYPASMPAWYVVDALVTGPLSIISDWGAASNLASQADINREGKTAVAVLYQYYAHPTGGGGVYTLQVLARLYRNWQTTPDTRDFFYENSQPAIYSAGFPRQILSGCLGEHRQASSSPITITSIYPAIHLATRGYFNHSASAVIGGGFENFTDYETRVSANYPTGLSGPYADGVLAFHPNPVTPTAFSLWINNKTTRPAYPIMTASHQGRVVSVSRQAINYASLGDYHVRDIVHYTAVNDPSEVDTTRAGFALDVGEENVSGIGVIASLSGQELLLVKHQGGAYSIQGDLANPTVNRLPFIESTYGITSMPASTPAGIVYGTRNGVFVWNGGDTAEKLSKQLDGFFWNHTTEVEYEANRGRFGWWHPWVCVPNNYLFDTRTGGWWRLADPATYGNVAYNVYGTDPSDGTLKAFPFKQTATQTTVYHTYDPAVLASSYQWRSQPLIETIENVVNLKEVRLVASPGSNTAACTVTVTVSGADGDGVAITPVNVVFTFTGDGSGNPIIKRADITSATGGMQVQHAQVTITASAVSGAAPKIHTVSLGIAERAKN